MERSVPRTLAPMLAKSSRPFDSASHLFELKWDGTRCLAFIDRRGVRLQNRRLADITCRYPEFRGLRRADSVVLDGELVVLQKGRPSFRRLQEREHIVEERRIARLSRLLPATYVVFDILYLKGRSLMGKPLRERRELLEAVLPLADNVVLSEAYGEGKGLFRLALGKGFEGVMAKERESPYLPGKRSGHWLKVKGARDMDAVVCGWLEGRGRRRQTFASLVLGAYEGGRLRYMGRVGTGFDERTLMRLRRILGEVEARRCPFEECPRFGRRRASWSRPELVVRVGYQEMTAGGMLRAPVFKSLRGDKRPEECTL